MNDMVFRKVYTGRDHKKDALLMLAIMRAESIVQAIEEIK